MIVDLKRFNFVKGTVTTHQRDISDTPPSTPLMDMLIAKAARKSQRPGNRK